MTEKELRLKSEMNRYYILEALLKAEQCRQDILKIKYSSVPLMFYLCYKYWLNKSKELRLVKF